MSLYVDRTKKKTSTGPYWSCTERLAIPNPFIVILVWSSLWVLFGNVSLYVARMRHTEQCTAVWTAQWSPLWIVIATFGKIYWWPMSPASCYYSRFSGPGLVKLSLKNSHFLVNLFHFGINAIKDTFSLKLAFSI